MRSQPTRLTRERGPLSMGRLRAPLANWPWGLGFFASWVSLACLDRAAWTSRLATFRKTQDGDRSPLLFVQVNVRCTGGRRNCLPTHPLTHSHRNDAAVSIVVNKQADVVGKPASRRATAVVAAESSKLEMRFCSTENLL